MHLDVGEVDLAAHVHVSAVIVQSHAPTDDLSDCAGHATSHLKGRPLLGERIAPEDLEIRWVMSLRSRQRGVGYLLGANRRFDGRQLKVVQKPATHRVS